MNLSTKRVIDVAQHLLDQPVTLVSDLSFSGRATVLRVKINTGETVIIKQHTTEEGRQRELMTFRTLSLTALTPKLIAKSDDLIVIEDLGSGPSVADLLMGPDASKAQIALTSWARNLGKIASATVGTNTAHFHERYYDSDSNGRVMIDVVAQLAHLWAIPLPVGMNDELMETALLMASPGKYRALCISDAACPDNNRVTDNYLVRFFDFEYAQWSHAAIDAAYCLVPFSSCWCVARLPKGLDEKLFASYCEGFPQANTPAFRRAATVVGVRFAFESLLRLTSSIQVNRSISSKEEFPLSSRQYYRTRLEWICAQQTSTPTQATFATRVLERFEQIYPGVVLPDYPAFASPA